MPDDRPPPTVPSPAQSPTPLLDLTRMHVRDVLSRCFAADQLTMDELDYRLDLAQHATSVVELQSLIADLRMEDAGPPVSEVDVPERDFIFAIMSGAKRRGSWLVPRQFKIIACMGGVDLDLTEAELAPGVSEIEAYAFMGGVQIRVPPWIRVDVHGSAFMGGFEERLAQKGQGPAPDAPVLRVRGFALMGGVDVRVREPKPR
jgi:hypothetical protein